MLTTLQIYAYENIQIIICIEFLNELSDDNHVLMNTYHINLKKYFQL